MLTTCLVILLSQDEDRKAELEDDDSTKAEKDKLYEDDSIVLETPPAAEAVKSYKPQYKIQMKGMFPISLEKITKPATNDLPRTALRPVGRVFTMPNIYTQSGITPKKNLIINHHSPLRIVHHPSKSAQNPSKISHKPGYIFQNPSLL